MSVHLFLGPTLPRAEATALLPEAVLHPPVAMGDVQRLMNNSQPLAIAIIDGFFEGQPAVWHKEILFALSQRVRVYGAASMGALRAAELHPFGMIGVGEIFEAFRDGVLEADDEVAIVHATEEHDHRALSDALVNIRYGLKLAEEAKLIERQTHELILEEARRTHYPARSWGVVLQALSGRIASDQVAALRQFIRERRPDRKREDALLLLKRLAVDSRAELPPPQPNFEFERTLFWQHVAQQVLEPSAKSFAGGIAALELARVTGQLREAEPRALLRHLIRVEAIRLGLPPPTPEAVALSAAHFRYQHGLRTAQATREWLEKNGLDAEAFTELMAFECTAAEVSKHHAEAVRRNSVEVLKIEGHYASLSAEAATREAFFRERGGREVSLTEAGVDLPEVYDWYQRRYLPFRGSAAEHALELGYRTVNEFNLEVTRQYVFERAHAARGS